MKPFWRTFPDLDTSKKMLEFYKEFGKKNRPLKMYKDAIFIFIMPPDLKTLMKRVIKRNRDPKDKMLKRFKEFG